MTLFWLAALSLALVAAVLLAWPLLRPLREEASSVLGLNAQVFRERLAELEKDYADARIDAETFSGLKIELERNLLLLADTSTENGTGTATAPQRAQKRSRLLFLLLMFLLPAAAGLFYYFVQFNPLLPQWFSAEKALAPAVTAVLNGQPPPADIDQHTLPEFIHAVQAHLQQQPDDSHAWFMLGISYLQVGMNDQARQGFERAWRLDPQRTEVVLAYAQSLILGNEGQITPPSRALLDQVLKVNPHHEGALILLGMGSYRAGDYATAVEAFSRLQALHDTHSEAGSEASQKIMGMLADARARLAEGKHPVAAAGGITVVVTVDRALADRMRPDDTVFIFAKAQNGPPMPLAAVRRPARELPLTVELNDSQSMLPSLKLSSVAEVVVNARISHSGTVMPEAGDLEAVAVPLHQDGKPARVELLIRDVRR
jgi:cytochrome c-type biogenesis protein CcmH